MLSTRTPTLFAVLVALFIFAVLRPAGQIAADSHTGSPQLYRSQQGECYDIALKDLFACQIRYRVGNYRLQYGDCRDVSLKELSTCRTPHPSVASSYRTHFGDCRDVAIHELTTCRSPVLVSQR